MLYAHNDKSGWGRRLIQAGGRLGQAVELFDFASDVPEGSCAFVRLDQQREQRELSKNLVAALNRRGVHTLPTAAEGVWYDDKVAQVEPLKDYLPPTRVFYDRDEAYDYINEGKGVTYPFISKSRDGASSVAVRLIETPQQAHFEINEAFGSTGFKSTYDRVQKDYLYWQKFIEGNRGDIRIVVTGDYIMGLRRWNRDDAPFASGSGKNEPIRTFLPGTRVKLAADICLEFAENVGTQWMAFDVVFEKDDEPFILELSSSWSPRAYEDCPLLTRNFEATDRTGAEMFEVAVEILQKMEFGL